MKKRFTHFIICFLMIIATFTISGCLKNSPSVNDNETLKNPPEEISLLDFIKQGCASSIGDKVINQSALELPIVNCDSLDVNIIRYNELNSYLEALPQVRSDDTTFIKIKGVDTDCLCTLDKMTEIQDDQVIYLFGSIKGTYHGLVCDNFYVMIETINFETGVWISICNENEILVDNDMIWAAS